MQIYNNVRKVPDNAVRPIEAGRLKGKSDINPMWRIKVLTEQFGPCGIGWYSEILKEWLETGASGEIAAFVNINLYIKVDGEWSKPIPGIGGSMFVANERNGLYVSDECYKMAYTDAISVACKALGVGADVYWDKDTTKYTGKQGDNGQGDDNKQPPQGNTARNDSGASGTPSELEKRATKIYYHCTGNKEGQLGWSKEAYNAHLKVWHDEGRTSTTFGKKWTLADIEFIEAQLVDLPF